MERHVCVRDSVCECVCVCVEVEQVGWGWGNGSDQHLVARSGFFPLDTLFFFLILIEFVIVLLLLCMSWFLGLKACGILAPQPGIEQVLPALDGKVLTSGPPWKSHPTWFLLELQFGGGD